MTLTKQEAIENHRKMWNWIADEIEKGNGYKYYGLANIKNEYFLKHNVSLGNRPNSDCYCCEYSGDCGDCPLKWPGGARVVHNGLYIKISTACLEREYIEAAKLARQIANLPENPNS
jgi:hypothetical protein